MRVDAVITWVDGSDEAWRAKKNHYTPGFDAINTADVAGRFRNNGELRYLLRSIEKYWPFEGNIFIVTDRQTPDFLRPDSRIKIIDHSEILQDHYLPTFSSKAIVSGLHRIPGLSEHFVVFNDDIFLSRPVSFEDFFGTKGYRIYETDEPVPELLGSDALGGHLAAFLSNQWAKAEFGKSLPFIPAHYPHGIKKSLMQNLEAEFPALFDATRSEKFRSFSTHSIISGLYLQYCYATQIADTRPDETLYLFSDAVEHGWAQGLLKEAIASKLCVCIQDTMDDREDTETFQRNLSTFLTELFPDQAEWEIDREIKLDEQVANNRPSRMSDFVQAP